MIHPRSLSSAALVAALALPAGAQHTKVSAIAVDPGDPRVVWVCNRDNDSISRLDTASGAAVEIPVGVQPRSLAFSADGTRLFVANQRGNVPLEVNFVTPFTGAEIRGTVSVVDVPSQTVTTTLTNVGVEPYGLAVAPNGEWFAVSGFRSGTITFIDAASLAVLHVHQYERNLSFLSSGTIADHDADRDGIADLGDPRGFVIRADSQRMYVTHFKSPWVSALDLTLDGGGKVLGASLAAKIDTNEYPFDPIYAPVPVQEVKSQGLPRFLEDIDLAPDGSTALVPHVLHNVNHDVNHDFGGAISGDAVNRVYPALTMIDTAADSYGAPGDASRRLHHELFDEPTPAEYIPYGEPGTSVSGDRLVLGGLGSPVLGGSATFVVSGFEPGDSAQLLYGNHEASIPFGQAGTLLVKTRFQMPMPGGVANVRLPVGPHLVDFTAHAQALVTKASGEQRLTNGVRFHLDDVGFVANSMGYRAGQPSRVLYSPDGSHALMLNRGSEDLFLYRIARGDLVLRNVFPPRWQFEPREALDKSTPMGDLPLGMAMVPDGSTVNDDALLYVINELTRTVSTLRVDFTAGTIQEELPQQLTRQGPDAFTDSERIGLELLEDASRPETAENFNNSCGSCHFEGGDDGNVWQRPQGPRSTMPIYGGTLGTGLVLWKGVRLNMGETGPMFGGENGGTGIFTDAEQQGLVDVHEKLAVPLNPNLDPLTGDLTATAKLGSDLFFGTNDTGLNPSGRHAGCAECHAIEELNPNNFPGPRFFTKDFVHPLLSGGEMLGQLDPDCFSLRESVAQSGIRNINSGVDVDIDGDGQPDLDRNADGYVDLETYAYMNADTDDPFQRDDVNSYLCPCDPDLGELDCMPNGLRRFTRPSTHFSIPTKLGAFASGPYFHDHVAYSLRTLLHLDAQALDPVYGSPAWPTPYPGMNKFFNGEHDILGHQDLVPNSSKVQLTLQSRSAQRALHDMEAILAFIQSL